jgi:hypothetical protein
MFTIAAYMEAVARDRAADRGCTGGGKVAGRRGPARSNSGRVFIFRGCAQLSARLASGARRHVQVARSAFGITVRALEPRGRCARLNLDAAGACPRGMMLILKYFLVVGAVLTMGLIALNAHLLPAGSTAPTALHSATSASLPTVAPKVQPAEPEPAVESSPPPPPAKSATPSHRSQRSARAQRRSQ